MTITVTTGSPIATSVDTALTIVEIARNVGREVSVTAPETIVGNSDATAIDFLNTITKACEEVSRRVDWGDLEAETSFSGTGAKTTYILPVDFSRLTQGASVLTQAGNPVRGGLSNDEWRLLEASTATPRYFHISGSGISFWPYLPSGETVSLTYQSKYFTNSGFDVFSADDDTLKIPHEVVEKCAIYKWRRRTGQSYADYEAEYEASLADYASFDVQDRTP